MLSWLIDFSLNNRFFILVTTGLMALGGLYSAIHLPIDAVPDMTNVQVQVLTDAGSLSPIEVERYVTNPLEWGMSGLPRVEEVRSVSKFGISLVTIVFEERTDVFWARNIVNERMQAAAANIPPGYGTPELGPMTTALGEILQFEVKGESFAPMQLRSILDWEVAPRLREVQGVTEINTMGGFFKTYEVRPDPNRLSAYGLSLNDIFDRIEANNSTAGGGYVVHFDEQRFIRGQALLKDEDDILNVVLRREAGGTPILVRDVADVAIAPMTRQGSVTRDGRGDAVMGMAMMLIGENSREVVERVKERLEEIEPTLPEGIELEVVYDRAHLIERTLETVLHNLTEGGLLVIIVLLFMLGSLRAGIITALAIPLSMLFATNLMMATGITASLMSLGAIDFGLIVDSSVIMIENCMHHLAHGTKGKKHDEVVRDAAIEVRKPTMFGELIIAIVYVPILALEGTEGKLFRPMALTVLFALAGSLVLSMTLMPVLAATFLPKNMKDKEVFLIRWIKWIYRPLVTRAIHHRVVTIGIALAVFLCSLPVGWNLGAEFMPRLVEGDLLVEAVRLPSATIEGAIGVGTQIENIVKEVPEVKTVFCKTGRPEIANDIMGVHQTDVWVMLKHKDHWREGMTRDDLIDELDEKLTSQVPGVAFGFTQPIEMRVDELVAGVKADVAVLLYGRDLDVLSQLAKQIERTLKTIPGSADVKADYQANLATVRIEPKRDVLARYGLNAEDVLDVVETLGGRETGLIFEDRARYPIMVRIPEQWRSQSDLLGQLPVSPPGGMPVPLQEVADIIVEETPPAVEHESNRRRTFVQCNVRGVDVASFVADAQRAIDSQVRLPSGYEIQWGGDFENLQSASRRLALITPIVLLLIFLLLHSTFKSVNLAFLIFLAVPMAASGGVYALALRGMPFSIRPWKSLVGTMNRIGQVIRSWAGRLHSGGVGLSGVSPPQEGEAAFTRESDPATAMVSSAPIECP